MQTLFAHAENRDHVYEHTGVWATYRITAAPNMRADFPADERRLLRRVGIEGDVPV